MKISVIVCTYNPKLEYLNRTLEGLKSQTLDCSHWEFLLIDNASSTPVADQTDLSWHPNARIVIEPQLGLTNARLRGFREAGNELVLMVDDDNDLASDFLENTLSIAAQYPKVGAWGASISGEFDEPVPRWLERELLFLAIRPITEIQMAEKETPGFPTPAGAGMTMRRQVIDHYISRIEKDPLRRELDRKGNSLVSAGDTDLATCAWNIGLGLANFPQLRLKHLIPKGRMQPSYMRRLHESMAYSAYVFKKLRGEDATTTLHSNPTIIRVTLREILRGNWHSARFFLSQVKGARKAHHEFGHRTIENPSQK